MRENLFEVKQTEGVPVYMWNRGVVFEEAAVKQLTNLAKMPFVYKHIAAMPDTHWGMGSTVGSVFASDGAVIPASVGVDIGCGMMALRTNLIKDDFLGYTHVNGKPEVITSALRALLEKRIPMGRTNDGRKGDRGAWHDIPQDVNDAFDQILRADWNNLILKHPALGQGNLVNHLGTLGTGNHFIEIQYDEQERIWIMLHSGSRGVGNRIGQYFIKKAKELMEQNFVQLPDKDLSYLPKGNPLHDDYIEALNWAQRFAALNRDIMGKKVVEAVKSIFCRTEILESINTHHNYAQIENHFGKSVLLTRKGAIRAGKGELGIIPGSMGAKSYIVRGLGNPLSFCSCSHGAGRAMSRTRALKEFTVDDLKRQTEGIDCIKDEGVLDEIPSAYKDIDKVIEAERDLVSVVHTLRQIVCCKGVS